MTKLNDNWLQEKQKLKIIKQDINEMISKEKWKREKNVTIEVQGILTREVLL